MLAYFGQIASVATEGVEPTSHVVPLQAPLREDEARTDRDDATREKLLALGSGSAAPFFRVPRFRKGS